MQWEALPQDSRGAGAHFSADPTWTLLMATMSSRPCDGLQEEPSWRCACEDLSVPSFFLTSLGIPSMVEDLLTEKGFSFTAWVEKGSICGSTLNMQGTWA